MNSKKGTIKIVVFTALISCLLTSTVKDIMYVQNHGAVNNKVKKIVNIIDRYSLYDVDDKKLADFAATGLTVALDDHYTNYYNEEEFASFNTNLSNSFYGVGIVISVDVETNKLIVISPIEGGPSANAGILPGDYIVKVDGMEYNADQMNEAVSVMRGDKLEEKKGTKVTVTVERDGELYDYEIIRDVVNVKSVDSKMLEDKTAYIRINSFNAAEEDVEGAKDTYDEFKEALDTLKSDGMEKLIIDLRNNPGGSLSVVNKIADELLPYGIITYTETKDGTRQDYTSQEGELDVPMAVLVNGGSASASEVLTGALRDYEKATVIGTKTFGKGIVQTVIPLGDGTGISITTSKYYSPKGVCIHGVGISPDITVEMDDSKQISELSSTEDIQLKKAIEVLN